MKYFKELLKFKIFFLFNFLVCLPSFADNHNIYDTLELIKKDLKTLEKAVYSNSSEFNNTIQLHQALIVTLRMYLQDIY